MSFSDYWENKILDHLFGKASYTAPAHIYVGLSLTNPLDDGSAIQEPSGGDYARVETAPADWDAASDGVISNLNDVIFPVPTDDWGTAVYGCLFDAASGGNFLAAGLLDPSVEIFAGPDAPLFTAGDITVTRN